MSDSHITFFHFTKWELTAHHVGQMLSITWPESNYWKQKLSRSWVPQLPALPNNVVVNGMNLSDISELLKHLKYASELLKEYVFEEIRACEFSSKPSRRRCLFAFSTNQDPEEYARRLDFDRSRFCLVTLRAVEGTIMHWGDMVHLSVNLSDHQGIAEAARKYWSGTDENIPTAEALIEGPVQLVNIL